MTDTTEIQFPDSTRRVPIANSEPGPAIGVGVHLGAPPIDRFGHGECWLVTEGGVTYASYYGRDGEWIEVNPPALRRTRCIDDDQIEAWSDEREPAVRYWLAKMVREGFADDEAEALTLLAEGE